jgi:pyruvate formate lyase activating enzyme
MKGCPLNCVWCHNPESKATYPEIFFDAKKCILCGKCYAACDLGGHHFEGETHTYDRTDCIRCGECAEQCVTDALEKVGYLITVEDAIAEVMKDEVFYKNSGGGMTLSGGEPMAQAGFTLALLTAAKEKGLHTCMETCGFASWENYEKTVGLVDIYLFDYKITDPELHKKCTGVSNERIRENLKKLDAAGAKTILRCPIIPTINDTPEHFAGIAEMANQLANVLEINIEPYHPLGSSKSAMLDKEYPLGDMTFPENETVEGWMETIRSMTTVPVKKA